MTYTTVTTAASLQSIIVSDWPFALTAADFSPKPKPEHKKIVFLDDPVAVACGSYRMYKETGQRWVDFSQVIVQDQDKTQAHSLKQYYNKKCTQTTFDLLKSKTGKGVTDFRRKLYMLCIDQLDITQQEIGLLHRLPYLYQEDLALDQIAATTKSAPNTVQDKESQEHAGIFRVIKQVLKSRATGEFCEYWFTRDQEPYAYMIPIQTNNMLIGIFDHFIQQPLPAVSLAYSRTLSGRPDHFYYCMKTLKPL